MLLEINQGVYIDLRHRWSLFPSSPLFCVRAFYRGWPRWCTPVSVETRPWCRCCWTQEPTLTVRSVMMKGLLLNTPPHPHPPPHPTPRCEIIWCINNLLLYSPEETNVYLWSTHLGVLSLISPVAIRFKVQSRVETLTGTRSLRVL